MRITVRPFFLHKQVSQSVEQESPVGSGPGDCHRCFGWELLRPADRKLPDEPGQFGPILADKGVAKLLRLTSGHCEYIAGSVFCASQAGFRSSEQSD